MAKKTIAESVRRSAIEQAQAFAAAAPGGPSLKAFQDVMPLWTKGGALEIEVKEQSDKSFAINVVRCRYAETYKAMGLGEIGHLLSGRGRCLGRALQHRPAASSPGPAAAGDTGAALHPHPTG